jgi:mannose-6-phosphate isomerase
VLVEGPHFRIDRVEGTPGQTLRAAYPAALLALPLRGEVRAEAGDTVARAGECLVASSLDQLDFSRAEVTLLTRPA